MLERPSNRIRGAILVALALAVLFSWSAATVIAKPPTREKARAVPRKKSDLKPKRVKGPRAVPGLDKLPPKGTSRAKSPLDKPVKVPGPGEPRPIIECKDNVKDFGTIWVGPVLEHAFTISNKGDAPLRITKVRPSCGCTIAGPYPREIKPGESGSFPFSVSSTKLRGKFEKGITIKSNDPASPNFRLRLRGQVKRYVELTPSAVNFGKLYGDEPMEKVVKIKNNTEEPIQVELGTQPKTPGFSAEVVTTEPGKAYELHVRATPPYKPGTIREVLLLKSSNENQRRISVNVRANIPKRLDVSPAVLTLRPPRPTQGKTPEAAMKRMVKLQNYGAKPVKILEATVNDPAVKVKVAEQTAGKRYAVEVEFPAGYSSPRSGRKLTIKTDDPQMASIDVP
ncbi:MAG: DUF1573 domain-containing protein, partial [Phycisphaerae bacterium]